jgi:exopolyphosphatase/guanosine-5'-triphosphate,3'-diphosphate pyrophosphatase
MKEHIGIIDLGSNTTRLIVMEYRAKHSFHLIDEVRETVRLAEGVSADNLLQPQAIYRAVAAMNMFYSLCRATNVNHVVAVGTSALRDAANQSDFLAMLKHETGLEMRVLSGEEEAYYAYLGAVNSLPIINGAVIDIGGGSTEIAEVCNRNFARWTSQPVGTVRYTERYVKSDPISRRYVDRRGGHGTKPGPYRPEAAKSPSGAVAWLRADHQGARQHRVVAQEKQQGRTRINFRPQP